MNKSILDFKFNDYVIFNRHKIRNSTEYTWSVLWLDNGIRTSGFISKSEAENNTKKIIHRMIIRNFNINQLN